MIKVTGQVQLKMPYAVKLDMSMEEFDNLSEKKQNDLIEEAIDWHSQLRSAETDDIDVWDIDEVQP